MSSWTPITEEEIWDLINEGEPELLASESRFFDAIRITPQKWKLDPWGEHGKGFWVVGIIGKTVLWYNDFEEGFNTSPYSRFGEIDEYWCNQDEFKYAIKFLKSRIDAGAFYAKTSAPRAGEYEP